MNNLLFLTEQRTEQDVCLEFDEFIESTGLFILQKEVCGKYLFGSQERTNKVARIDRIIVPQKDASQSGLLSGPIGIEIKLANDETKWGGPINQALDYRSAAFNIFSNTANIHCVLDTIFLFPMPNIGGPVESIMCNNRIGTALISGDYLSFKLGSTTMLKIKRNSADYTFNVQTLSIGRKYGSR